MDFYIGRLVSWKGKAFPSWFFQKGRVRILKSLHNQLGHLGIERTLALARDCFYWPRMLADVTTYIKDCGGHMVKKNLP